MQDLEGKIRIQHIHQEVIKSKNRHQKFTSTYWEIFLACLLTHSKHLGECICSPVVLQPGGAGPGTHTSLLKGANNDCPSKHAQQTCLGWDPVLCFSSLPAPASIPMETKRKCSMINSGVLILLPLHSVADETPQYNYFLGISCDFCNKSAGWKGQFCLPGMKSRRALCLLLAKLYVSVFSFMCWPCFKVFLTRCAGCWNRRCSGNVSNSGR